MRTSTMRVFALPGIRDGSVAMRKLMYASLVAIVSAILLLCGCRGGTGPALDASAGPLKFPDHNIVLVSFDALQAAHVGCLGYSRNVTPTIDTIAREGFNFTRTYSVASW